MNSKYLHALFAAALMSTAAAQAQAQEAAPIQPSPQQPQDDERDPLIRWGRGKMEVRQMLRLLDEACPQTILIGEGVGGSVEHLGKSLRLSQFLDALAQAADLSWGYLNRDTIVVLPAHKATSAAPNLSQIPAPIGPLFRGRSGKSFTTPLIPGVPYYVTPLPGAPRRVLPPTPRAPGQMPNPLGETNPDPQFSLPRDRPQSVPDNARPYSFNGRPLYLIPLQPAPAPQPDEQPQQ